MAVANWHGRLRIRMGNGVVSNRATQRVAAIGVWQQAVASTTGAVADVGNRVGSGQHVGDHGDNHHHNHNEEVINDNNEHPGFPAITGRSEQPVNRR